MNRWIAPAALLLAGCSGMPTLFSKEYAIEVSEAARSGQCNTAGPESRVSLLADTAAVEAWQQEHGVSFGVALPQGPFALVEMGERNTGGYGLAISRLAGRRGDTLVLNGTFIAPAAEDMTTQAITSPCVLVSLPKQGYSQVEIIDQDGRVRGRSGQGS
ncbi:MAG TPA: protease complex subunit PrcB family protein [Solimonas sp.]|nr:protease complex subunit PrcB family protein [Solimonas sp.]